MQPAPTVLGRVFEGFLEKLRVDNVPPEVIARLKDLLAKRQLKTDLVKAALFAEDNLP